MMKFCRFRLDLSCEVGLSGFTAGVKLIKFNKKHLILPYFSVIIQLKHNSYL